MLMSRTYRKDTTEWLPSGAMYGGVCAFGLSSSALDSFSGRLGQETSINRRKIRV